MKKNRPVNLDLTTIRLPITAIASILHRITGVILFVGLAFLIWALSLSLSSAQGFEQISRLLATSLLAKFIAWGILTALGYHLVAGVRHLLMDIGIGETKAAAQQSSVISLALGVILAVLAGVWLW